MGTHSLEQLEWLAGNWTGGGTEQETEEHWLKPAGGTMLGVGRTIEGGKTTHREHMLIEQREQGIFYVLWMGIKPAVDFELTGVDGQSVIFENPNHSFPQKIVYRRDGESLHARIEGQGGERTMEWSWTRG